MKKVGVIMGSDSDLPVVEKAIDKLKEYGVPYEVHVYSAHRTPVQAGEFARTAQENGFGAIIAAAGKAAHLAGALAAGIAGVMTSYYLGPSAGAAITLYLAVWFAVTFLLRKRG